jgi:hypothetical protein
MILARCLRHAAAGVMLTLAAGAAHAAAWDIDQLMQVLAHTRSERATFSEKKFIALLDAPVQSSGELYYAAPDRLEKRTLKPRPEAMVLDQGTLTIERGRQKHRLQLHQHPELAAFIDSIRGTLAGDRKALERSFRLQLDGSAEQWTLQLVPVDKRMLAVVERIRMTGTGDAVRSVEVNQADGDRSLMLIQRVSKP